MKKSGITPIEMPACQAVAKGKQGRRQWRKGFTLIEMLVVIAIIALLASILVPAVTKALARGRMVQCANNMRGLSQAMLQYTLQHTKHQVLPIANDSSQSPGQRAWSYRLLEAGIFPEYGSVGELLRKNEFFRCPSDKGPGEDKPSFAMNNYISSGSGTFEEYRYLSTIEDPSQTILFGEVWGRQDDAWYTKVNPGHDFAAFERHDGKANYAFLDGHVETLRYQQQIEPDDEAWIDLWRPDL